MTELLNDRRVDTKDFDQLSINTIRTLAMDAVQAANSGHPGIPMALATKFGFTPEAVARVAKQQI